MTKSLLCALAALALLASEGAWRQVRADEAPIVRHRQAKPDCKGSKCGPYVQCGPRCRIRCPDGYSCTPLYGAYGPYGGVAYWGGFTYSGWGEKY